MLELIVMFVVVVVTPLLLVAGCTSLVLLVRAWRSATRPHYVRVLKALMVALLVALLFPVAFSLTIGLLLDGALGYGYAIVLLMLTAIVTLICFAYVARNGIPTLSDLLRGKRMPGPGD